MRRELLAWFFGIAFTLTPFASQSNSFSWSYQSDFHGLDPHSMNESFTTSFLSNVYEGLVRRKADMTIEPALAVKWESLTPRHWRFYLRKNVTFHNGNKFDADDVIFSANRASSAGSDMRTLLPKGMKVVKVDEYTVDFMTKDPEPRLYSAWDAWLIMDKEWSEKHGAQTPSNAASGKENFAHFKANGTGAFTVVSREEYVETVLQPFKNWWDTANHNLTEVKFKPINSSPTRVAALLSGEIDVMLPTPVQDVARINKNPETSVLTVPALRTIFLGMDQLSDELVGSNIKGKNPFKNPLVRQAFAHAIDVDLIKKKIMKNMSEPSALMIAPTLFKYSDGFQRLTYDPKKAKDLLADAGYPDGFELTMDCPNNRYLNDEKICQAAAGMLAKVGVKTRLLAQPKALYFKKVLGYDTSFYLLGWEPSSLESLNVLENLHGCRDESNGRGKYNIGGYCNTEVDQLIDQIKSQVDLEQRDLGLG